ncbi:CDP-glycerol glycerophosphotransferase family protein [Microbacterium fluvii]|uniref:CDP-glycerol glycerophosphotransferase family protein n=1 Tax=Microbacterium fluvii TaxID=415215 RepID=A0ABW2H8W4_9MICO|nr:CDP-glycerol glycerophosphotransferase family protein [Microbacterium fluvii]MCU4671428.1 CDP-glycerol glycerophosphotransferase family protein [Microbacterium fluvii]
MIDKLLEGKLLTLLVGSVFRAVEIFVRAIHLGVRGVRLVVQEKLTTPIDRRISRVGKRRVARTATVDDASIVFVETDGEYTGDAKYIAEELLRRAPAHTITWVLRAPSVGPFPREFRFVREGTADCFRAIARAKVVVHDGRRLHEAGVVKSPDQLWLQAWPGGSALDPQTDVVLTGSTSEDDLLAGAPARRLRLGHARNDLLVDTSPGRSAALRKKVLDRLHVAETGQRFLLYAPARSDDALAAPLSGIDFAALRSTLSERFGGTWDVLVRAPHVARAEADMWLAGLPAYCHNASRHPDLQELLAVADAGMTDRSGWMSDYLLTGRPAFLFATPLGAERAGAADLPLPVATSSAELLAAVAHFDREAHADAIGQFLSRRGSVDDGGSAARIVDEIIQCAGRPAGGAPGSRESA